ncbi:MAG: penicillin-binding protein activator LpoB [Planctomycetes bacterium]|nr:penicillin-binding protein activator LpoB [Planctomycetota bacterium]
MKRLALPLSLLLLLLTGCFDVKRVDEAEVIDISGNWNDTDSQKVAHSMISEALQQRWISEFVGANKRKPVLIVGRVDNNTSEVVNTITFTKELERAFVSGNEVQVVAGDSLRPELREERKLMEGNASPETMKQLGRETGADMMLVGQVNEIIDQRKGDSVRYYQVNLEVIELQTHLKKWIGEKKIKKVVTRKKFGIF